MSRIRVRLTVGMYLEDVEDERAVPFVAGCIDQTTWEVVDADESDRWANELKRRFDPELDSYEWREVLAEFDSEALKAAFRIETVRGEVVQ